MSLYLDVVCTEARLTSYERQEKSVQVIGEILPYVLAKYGVSSQLADRKTQAVQTIRPERNVLPPTGREVPVRRLDF